MTGRVDVVWPSIRRRLREMDGVALLLLVRIEADQGAVVSLTADAGVAISMANEAAGNDETHTSVRATLNVVPARRGVFIELDAARDETGVEAWVHDLAKALSRSGWSGRVTVPAGTWESAKFQETQRRQPSMHVFSYFSLEPPDGTPTYEKPPPHWPLPWWVPTEVTAELSRATVDWTLQVPASHSYLGLGRTAIRVEEPDVTATLDWFTSRCPVAAVLRASKDHRVWRSTHVMPLGGVVHNFADSTLDWRDQVLIAKKMLLTRADALDLGLIRWHHYPAISFEDLSVGRPSFPHINGAIYHRYNRWAVREWVPDAHGVQVVNSTQLDRAHDLRSWRTVSVGNGRFLLESRDLEGWYGSAEPDPVVVAAARADFGAMIITAEDITAHPDGWMAGTTHPVRWY